jgi:hypothetical protein
MAATSYLVRSHFWKGGPLMNEWLTVIQEVGFPIFVSFYLMHRVETKLQMIHEALISLKTT